MATKTSRNPLRAVAILAATAALAACSNPAPQEGRIGFSSSAITLWNSHGEADLLRVGESLSVSTLLPGQLAGNAKYQVRIAVAGGTELVLADLLTTHDGRLPLATILHDAGEFDGVRAGSTLDVTLTDPDGAVHRQSVMVSSSRTPRQGAGWDVDEAQPPHVFAADASGAPQNAFAVGAATLAPGEVGGEIFAAGDGFPPGAVVDLYVARDADVWVGKAMPRPGDPAYIAGPVTATVDADGRLAPTRTGFVPAVGHVGIYDVLVDVDRNGVFDWSFNVKDGADGEQKVGLTVQLSQSWLAERTSKHILVNLAYDSAGRDEGVWRNAYTPGEPVYMYVNPPVMTRYHASAKKWVVRHQDWDTFWNSPAADANVGGAAGFGRRPIADLAISELKYKPQNGCTNSPPLVTFNAEPGDYDMVIDFDGDGFYDIGRDLLDVFSGDAEGGLVDPAHVSQLPAAQRVGFSVR
ncbi:MAG TPA: hypothetical protein VGQ83_24495 [Polyangia bacterium]|jgi:hypothetical protein